MPGLMAGNNEYRRGHTPWKTGISRRLNRTNPGTDIQYKYGYRHDE